MYRRCNARAVQLIKATATQVPAAVQSKHEKKITLFYLFVASAYW